MSNQVFKWKMIFNPDPRMQGQEVIFSRKLQKISHPSIYFNNYPIKQVPSKKHLGMILDTALNFQEHIKCTFIKVNKSIGYYGSCKIPCLEHDYLQYLNRLPSLSLITAMLYMTKFIITLFIRKWSQYNITQHQL